MSASPGRGTVFAAWERFVQGEDQVPGVRPVVAISWRVGFLRMHRRYVVNLSRIREIERGLKGELFLVMGDRTNDMVPVSRRNAPVVRRALEICGPRHNLCSRKDSRV